MNACVFYVFRSELMCCC